MASRRPDDTSTRQQLSEADVKAGSAVKVFVRVRPLSAREKEDTKYGRVCIAMADNTVTILLPDKGYQAVHSYPFDGVLWSADTDKELNAPDVPFSTQDHAYKTVAGDLVANMLSGYNSCLFAYGQTGSGKTFTMMGGEQGCEDRGVIPRLVDDIFTSIDTLRSRRPDYSFTLSVSYMEIYQERVHDLLDPAKGNLKVRQHPVTGVFVEGLTHVPANNVDGVLAALNRGNEARHVAATKMNHRSSRSHSIFTVSFHCMEILAQDEQEMFAGIATNSRSSKLNLVDLAGSERTSKSGVEGESLVEATKINLSLTTLGRVIDALADLSNPYKRMKAVQPPFRDSQLTYILSDSLGGNSKTTMVATISPHFSNLEETQSTLRYASRAREIINKAVRNEDPSLRRIKELIEENEKLKRQLNQVRDRNFSANTDMRGEILDLREQVQQLSDELQEARGLLGEERERVRLLSFRESDDDVYDSSRSVSTLGSSRSRMLAPLNSSAANIGKPKKKKEDDVQRVNEKLQQKNEKLKEEVRAMREAEDKERMRLEREVGVLQGKLRNAAKVEKVAAKTEKSLEVVAVQLAATQQEMEEVLSEKVVLERRIAKLAQKVAAAEARGVALEQVSATLQMEKDDIDARASRLARDVEAKEQQIGELQHEKTELSVRLARAEERVGDLEHSQGELVSRYGVVVAGLNDELQTAHTALELAQGETGVMQTKVAEAWTTVFSLAVQHEQAQRDLIVVNEALARAECNAHLAMLKETTLTGDLQREVTRLLEVVQHAKEEATERNATAERLSGDLAAVTHRCNEEGARVSTLTDALAASESSVAELTTELRQSRDRIEELEAKAACAEEEKAELEEQLAGVRSACQAAREQGVVSCEGASREGIERARAVADELFLGWSQWSQWEAVRDDQALTKGKRQQGVRESLMRAVASVITSQTRATCYFRWLVWVTWKTGKVALPALSHPQEKRDVQRTLKDNARQKAAVQAKKMSHLLGAVKRSSKALAKVSVNARRAKKQADHLASERRRFFEQTVALRVACQRLRRTLETTRKERNEMHQTSLVLGAKVEGLEQQVHNMEELLASYEDKERAYRVSGAAVDEQGGLLELRKRWNEHSQRTISEYQTHLDLLRLLFLQYEQRELIEMYEGALASAAEQKHQLERTYGWACTAFDAVEKLRSLGSSLLWILDGAPIPTTVHETDELVEMRQHDTLPAETTVAVDKACQAKARLFLKQRSEIKEAFDALLTTWPSEPCEHAVPLEGTPLKALQVTSPLPTSPIAEQRTVTRTPLEYSPAVSCDENVPVDTSNSSKTSEASVSTAPDVQASVSPSAISLAAARGSSTPPFTKGEKKDCSVM